MEQDIAVTISRRMFDAATASARVDLVRTLELLAEEDLHGSLQRVCRGLLHTPEAIRLVTATGAFVPLFALLLVELRAIATRPGWSVAMRETEIGRVLDLLEVP